MINYVQGDATAPVVKNGTRIIAHVCNDIGKWGKGFVLAISKKWKNPELAYRLKKYYELGTVDIIPVKNNIHVANMIGQHRIYPQNGVPPVRYESIELCLNRLAIHTHEITRSSFDPVSIHLPRIGCGLAGGKWNRIEDIIGITLISRNIPVYVYDYKK